MTLHPDYNYSCSTWHYIEQLWVRWPLQPLQSFQQTQLQPPFSQSVDSLCHPWFTTTNVSYRFPILKLPPPPCAVLLVIIWLKKSSCWKPQTRAFEQRTWGSNQLARSSNPCGTIFGYILLKPNPLTSFHPSNPSLTLPPTPKNAKPSPLTPNPKSQNSPHEEWNAQTRNTLDRCKKLLKRGGWTVLQTGLDDTSPIHIYACVPQISWIVIVFSSKKHFWGIAHFQTDRNRIVGLFMFVLYPTKSH